MTGRARILVVDDDPGVARAVERVLGRDHEVMTVLSPPAALEQAETFRPELVVLDVRMPVMNGFELRRRLGEVRDDLDFIFMTGSATDTDAHLIRAIREGAFYFIPKPFDREVLRTLVDRCLELRRLREDHDRHADYLQRELDEARRFQRSLLPVGRRRLRGLEINARSLACAELGGDLYDYATARADRVAVLVADVAGHGASAAMMTGIVKSAFHAARVDAYDPQKVIERVAEAMEPFEPDRFVTLVCGRIDADGTLEYVNAGHPPPVVWSRSAGDAAEPELLWPTGPLISSGFREIPWRAERARLGTDRCLLLYTDGVVETPGEAGELFGWKRVVQAVTESTAAGGGLIDELIQRIDAFSGNRPRTDDVTLLVAERN